jgi:hypothetical protein
MATWFSQDTWPNNVDTPSPLIFRMGHWLCHILFCQERLPLLWLWIAVSRSLLNYHTYKTNNHWGAVVGNSNVRSSQDLLRSIFAVINIWTLWMPFSVFRTWLYGKAKPSNHQALVTLIRLKFIIVAKQCILSATALFINQDSHAAGECSSIIFL